MKKKSNKLESKIREYIDIKKIGEAIVDGCDLIIRLRLGQLNCVSDILKKYCSLYQESKGPDINEPLYKAIELGEYIKCLQEHKDCKFVNECWITRKGYCKIGKKNK